MLLPPCPRMLQECLRHSEKSACTSSETPAPPAESPHTEAETHHRQIKSGFRMSQKHVLCSDKKRVWFLGFIIKNCERQVCFENHLKQQRPQWPRPGLGGWGKDDGCLDNPVTGGWRRGARCRAPPVLVPRVPSGLPGICT